MRSTILALKRARVMRRAMSLPEMVLWARLRSGRLRGLQFRRQHPLGVYILDFYCPAARLAVEVDGSGHGHPEIAAHDDRRDAWLSEQQVRVLRIPARLILDRETLDGVLVSIIEAASRRDDTLAAGD